MSDNRNIVWTLEEDELLIDFVKNHELLYNVKCKDYRNTQLKMNVWKELAKIMGNKTGNDCSKRWAYVRDYYIRRKKKPGTGSPGEIARKRAAQLAFLDSCSSIKRRTITRTVKNEQHFEEIDEEDSFDGTQDTDDYQTNEMSIPQMNNTNTNETISRTKTKKSKHSASNSELRLKIHKQIVGKQNTEEPDETDLFFASMAKIVKRLPVNEQVCLRLQIGTMVGNTQLKCLQQQDDNF